MATRTGLTTVCVLLAVPALVWAQGGQDVQLGCPQGGWNVLDGSCIKIMSDNKKGWNGAQAFCKSVGGNLVRLDDLDMTQTAGQMAAQQGATSFWIGFSTDSMDQSTWADNSVSSESVGFWSNDDPLPVDAGCAYLSQFSGMYRWSIGDCNTLMNFMCQRSACSKDSFHCSTDQCINQAWVCDGVDDCGDFSDELNCSSRCSHHQVGSMGAISAVDQSGDLCHWLIEAPLGSNINLNVTSVGGNLNPGDLLIFEGGRTESSSRLLQRVTTQTSLVLWSSSNFMYIKYHRLSSSEHITADWRAVSMDMAKPGQFTEQLTAGPQQETVEVPGIALGNQEFIWVMASTSRRQVVTVVIEEMELIKGDRVEVIDGAVLAAPVLVEYPSDKPTPHFVTSTQENILVHLVTSTYSPERRFKFSYKQGCEVTSSGDSGIITSPGNFVRDYPAFLSCTFYVRPAAKVTLFLEEIDLGDGDVLQVYSGASEPGTLLFTSGGTPLPSDGFVGQEGDQLYLQLNTSYVDNAKGFYATYSIDCAVPTFNAQTESTPIMTSAPYKSNFSITCKTGYRFGDEMYQTGMAYVEMECERDGRWNVPIIPQCEPMYCGFPPLVENGYVESWVGVVYQDTVTYGCFDGYDTPVNSNITCESNGTWSATPTCTASKCPSVPPLVNGNITMDGDGSSYSTVLLYTCDTGYQIIGANRIFCRSDSSWSHAFPTCSKLQCGPPGMIMNGQISAPSEVFFGDEVSVSCDSGYMLSGPSLLTCQADQGYGDLPKCIDVDECAQVGTNDCTGVAMCQNQPGMHTCECPAGYTLNNDGLSCSDIDECAGEHFCNHDCVNHEGGYTCGCRNGYQLFDGTTEGYNVPGPESGFQPGDVYYVNHTCVRVVCPAPAPPNDTVSLSDQPVYYYENWITYMCRLGFILSSGMTRRQCQANGTWSAEPPVCSVAFCAAERIPDSVKNRPEVSPGGAVKYLDSVTLTCNIPGMDAPIVKRRTCLYDQPTDTYRFFGAPFECGYIDCGQPDWISGAKDYRPMLNNITVYGESFDVECLPLFTLDGQSSLGNSTVPCLKSGHWGFNTLRCLGESCKDPGRPPDGTQWATGYEVGKEVTYTCNRPGYVLNDTMPLRCVQNQAGTELLWNRPVPSCKDEEAPKFDYCPQDREINQFETANFDVPSARDNSGLVLDFRVTPPGFSPAQELASSVQVIYRATDSVGLSSTCPVNVHVRAIERPEITCQDGQSVRYNRSLAAMSVSETLVSYSGMSAHVTFTPPQFVPADIGKYVTVEAQVSDRYGRAKACGFQIHVQDTECKEDQIRSPINGQRACTDQTGLSCNLTCNSGFTFYEDVPGEAFLPACTDTTNTPQWSSTDTPNCVSTSTRAQLTDVFQYRYESTEPLTQECVGLYRNRLVEMFTGLSQTESDWCSRNVEVPLTVTVPQDDISVQAEGNTLSVNFTTKYSPINETRGRLQLCSRLVRIFITTDEGRLDYLRSVGAGNCSGLSASAVSKLDMTNSYTCPSHQKLKEVDDIWRCLNCPAGTFVSVESSCQPCGVGSYQPGEGVTSCLPCPQGLSTYGRGSRDRSQCTAMCPSGWISNTGLPPCRQCPPDTYWANSRECVLCPTGEKTLATGAENRTQCIAACPPGSFSGTQGLLPCTRCPRGFYQSLVGQTTCLECPAGYTTNSTGTITEANCVNATTELCSKLMCHNGGDCMVENNRAYCQCPLGYTGEMCEAMVDHCDSQPCYYGNKCNSFLNGYSCSCTQPENSCPKLAKTVDQYKVPSFNIPIAGVIQPRGLDIEEPLLQSTTLIYTPGDEGLNNQCQVSITVTDVEPILLTCPPSKVEFISTADSPRTLDFTSLVTVPAGTRVTVRPPSQQINYDHDLDSVTEVVVTASRNGYTATCSFQVAVQEAVCTDMFLEKQVNGEVSDCDLVLGTYTCRIACNQGSTFYGLDEQSTDSFACDPSTGWESLPQCITGKAVSDMATPARVVFETATGEALTNECLDQLRRTFGSCETNLVNELAGVPDYQTSCVNINLDISDKYLLQASGSQVFVDLQVTYTDFSNTMNVSVCKTIVSDNLNQTLGSLSQCRILNLTENTPSCPVVHLRDLQPTDNCPAGSSQQLINGNSFCIPCPPGTYYQGRDCIPCPLHEHNDKEAQPSCTRCPSGSGTRKTGTIYDNQCIHFCRQPYRSATGLPPCTECPKGYYYANETSCEKCPDGSSTADPGAGSRDPACVGICPKGWYSFNGLMPCHRCPPNYYQSSSGQRGCEECPENTTTTVYGSTSQSDCQDAAQLYCNQTVCINGGSCTARGNGYECICPEGFYGENCQLEKLFYGEDCEVERNDCGHGGHLDRCDNAGMCQDLPGNYTCLCPPGFSGRRCEDQVPVCDQKPCVNGRCENFDQVRRVCTCDVGYTGRDCQVNIDDCASSPCLFGGRCVDELNNYTCECSSGYGGRHCDERLDLCTNQNCNNSGRCVDDHVNDTHVCVCGDGYQPTAGSLGCVAVDGCASNPCSVPGSSKCSSSAPGQYNCVCKQGYRGSLCQHNEEDCDPNPCQNGAACQDQIADYICHCPPGFEGKNCEVDIDDCTGDVCDLQGFVSCTDLPNDFNCTCKPGYMGKNCSEEVDECASFPCFHGGRCTDLVANFSCGCVEGWEGKQCDRPTDKCQKNPCQNQGECVSIFNTYFCRCSGNKTYGGQCAFAPAGCSSVQPCLNSGQCSDSDTGVSCSCQEVMYTGEGCETRADPFGDKGCQNGGEPSVSLSGALTCSCRPGYTGSFCETNVDDCLQKDCPGARCVDAVNMAFCRCPVGWTGVNCAQEINVDYDLHFYSMGNSGRASLPYPVATNLLAFTVSLWVRFQKANSEGTYFMVFTVPSESSLEGKSEVVRISSAGARVSLPGFSPQSLMYSSSLLKLEVNDGKWHHIAVVVGYSIGAYHIRFTTDGATVGTKSLPGTGYTTDTFLWVTLGSQYDPNTEAPVVGKGFRGYLSQVTLYGRAIDFDTEIPVIAENTTAVLAGAVLRWAEFTLFPGVNRVIGSSATPSDEQCPDGFTGPSCTIRTYSGRRVPRVECPSPVEVYSEARLTDVEWSAPKVSQQTAVQSNFRSGESFTWGRYVVIYKAQDTANTSAICSFVVYVKNSACNNTLGPDWGEFNLQMYNRYTNFNLTCFASNQRLTQPTPDFYTCGPSGYMHTSIPQKFIPFRFPSCGEVGSTPGVKLTLTLKYSGNLKCDNASIRNIRTKTLERVRTLNSQSGSKLCQTPDCSDVIVIVECPDGVSRRKRQVPVYIVTMTIPYTSPLIPNNNVDVPPDALILGDLTDGGFSLSGVLPGSSLDVGSSDIAVTQQCPPGEGLVGGDCVLCGRGYEYNVTSEACEACPLGEYKDIGMAACMSCEAGLTTLTTGSPEQADCKENCTAGQYYKQSGCVPCEVGFYQPSPGQFVCLPCGVGQTTLSNGTRSEQECFNKCKAGFELKPLGDCEPCQIGYYRPENQDGNCVKCPSGRVTPTTNSTSVNDCTVVDCQAGTHINGSQCEDCRQGEYQPLPYQHSCLSCPGSNSTRSTRSTSLSDCESYCPSGQEKVGEICMICEVGFYKDNTEDLFQECTQCPIDYITPAAGSISATNCSIRNCSAGTFRDVTSNQCVPCAVGYYQPNMWQSQCDRCPLHRVTSGEGSTSMNDCNVMSCHPGWEEVNGTCLPCNIGFYKAGFGAGPCVKCSGLFRTAGTGAESQADCDLVACEPGHYNSSNTCSPCPYGQYQPDQWENSCLLCGSGQITLMPGAIRESQCVADCGVGSEYNSNYGNCTLCQRGYYRDKSSVTQVQCEACDDGWVTPTPGATKEQDCNMRNCSAGSFWNMTSGVCHQCPKGQFQPNMWSSSCMMCPGDTTTILEGARALSDCLAVCSPGEGGAGGVCEPCPRGTYKEGQLAGVCTPCPAGKTTASTGTDHRDKCSQTACDPGSYRDDQTNLCELCPYGTYQPDKWQDMCEQCPQGKTTLSEGNSEQRLCVADCVKGSEYNTVTKICVECGRGYYRDKSSLSQISCVICPNGLITLGTGTETADDCNVANCTEPGTYRKSDTNTCEACPVGEYQDTKWQDSCKPCGYGLSTRNTGSGRKSDCIAFCPSGQELDGNKCNPCERGFYKNNADDQFGTCTACNELYITPSVGSIAATDCSQRNCSAGFKRSELRPGLETCEQCPVGTYQPQKWQTQCLACPGGKSTQYEGAIFVSECFFVCDPGQAILSGGCSLCPRGFYSSGGVDSTCVPCPADKTTAGIGAKQPTDCSQTACLPGYQRTITNTCELCSWGTYQPQKWQDTCLSCPAGLTTVRRGSVASDECVEQCSAGSSFDASLRSCVPCVRGTYREAGTPQANCDSCPIRFITTTTGSQSSNDCVIANCTDPGTYRNVVSNECQPCPQGMYQTSKWQDRCLACPGGTTTTGTGAVACLNVCDIPGYCQNNGTCRSGPTPCLCPAAYYGDRCETRRRAEELGSAQQSVIIGSVVGVLVFLIVLALVITGICASIRNRRRKEIRKIEGSSIIGATRLVTNPYLYGEGSMAGSIDMNRSYLKFGTTEENVGQEFFGYKNPAFEEQDFAVYDPTGSRASYQDLN